MGRFRHCDNVDQVKKGAWTPEEDQKLFTYVQLHGHGSWRVLPSKAGLKRSGKSCRLRWKNYLRPDIKRGKFSWQEEQTIIQLHALLGNRWSTMASHLPRRTDNEIKNYWNTHLKKRLTQMGIDPTTHRPKDHALGCGQPKDFVNLCHMAQWESARVEAESRQVHESKLISNLNYLSTTSTTAATTTTAPPQPPCLDILKVWIRTNSEISSSHEKLSFTNMNVVEMSQNGQTFEDEANGVTRQNGQTFEDQVKGIMGNSVELHGFVVNPTHDELIHVDDSLEFSNFMQSFTDLPLSPIETADNVVGGYWGF